ncbi:MAG: ribonuclease P [Desulfurococcaceae archaeon]
MNKRSGDMISEIAKERILILYKMSIDRVKKGEKDLARRYIKILLKIAGKAHIRPPKYIRRGYCRKCLIPLIPGLTASVRIKSEGKGSRVIYRCLECGWIRRYMIKTSKTRLLRELREK